MDLLAVAGTLVNNIFGYLTENVKDKSAVAQLKLQIDMAALQGVIAQNLQQAAINVEEAKKPESFWQHGRGAAMWVCVFGLAWQCLIQPLLIFGFALFSVKVAMPPFDTSLLITLLMGMLGLGSMRTFERIRKSDEE